MTVFNGLSSTGQTNNGLHEIYAWVRDKLDEDGFGHANAS
jgi:hypothetical protein